MLTKLFLRRTGFLSRNAFIGEWGCNRPGPLKIALAQKLQRLHGVEREIASGAGGWWSFGVQVEDHVNSVRPPHCVATLLPVPSLGRADSA